MPVVVALIGLDDEVNEIDLYASNRAKADAVAQTKEDLGPITCQCFRHLTYPCHSYQGRGHVYNYWSKLNVRVIDTYSKTECKAILVL